MFYHFFRDLEIKTKRIEPSTSEFPQQQVIATIKTSDGLKLADLYDTAFPEINKSHINLLLNAGEMFEALGLILADNRLMNAMSKDQARLVLDVVSKIRGDV